MLNISFCKFISMFHLRKKKALELLRITKAPDSTIELVNYGDCISLLFKYQGMEITREIDLRDLQTV